MIQSIQVVLVSHVMVTDTDQWFWDPAIEWYECLKEKIKSSFLQGNHISLTPGFRCTMECKQMTRHA